MSSHKQHTRSQRTIEDDGLPLLGDLFRGARSLLGDRRGRTRRTHRLLLLLLLLLVRRLLVVVLLHMRRGTSGTLRVRRRTDSPLDGRNGSSGSAQRLSVSWVVGRLSLRQRCAVARVRGLLLGWLLAVRWVARLLLLGIAILRGLLTNGRRRGVAVGDLLVLLGRRWSHRRRPLRLVHRRRRRRDARLAGRMLLLLLELLPAVGLSHRIVRNRSVGGKRDTRALTVDRTGGWLPSKGRAMVAARDRRRLPRGRLLLLGRRGRLTRGRLLPVLLLLLGSRRRLPRRGLLPVALPTGRRRWRPHRRFRTRTTTSGSDTDEALTTQSRAWATKGVLSLRGRAHGRVV